MIDLTKKALPNTVRVNGVCYSIYTDYRVWLRFVISFEKWRDEGFKGSLDIRYLFKNDLPVFRSVEDYKEILEFAFPPSPVPHGKERGNQVLFYDVDGSYIYASFYQQYGIDLLKTDMHWHAFMALLNATKGTKLEEIMGYRAYTGEKKKDFDAEYRALRDAWTPVRKESEEERLAEERFNDYFG